MKTVASASRKLRTKMMTLMFVGRSSRILSTRTAARLPSSLASSTAWWETLSSAASTADRMRSEEHTSELQSRGHLVCRLLLEKKKKKPPHHTTAEVARGTSQAC